MPVEIGRGEVQERYNCEEGEWIYPELTDLFNL